MQENKRQKNKNTFKFITRKLIYLNFLLYFILKAFVNVSLIINSSLFSREEHSELDSELEIFCSALVLGV